MSASARPSTRTLRSRRGIVTFEYVLLVTLLVIGIIGGLAVVRDALISEMGDMGQAIQAMFGNPDEDQQSPKGPPVQCLPGDPHCGGLP